jgi:hypothetical protein
MVAKQSEKSVEKIRAYIPLDATGHAVRINGKRYQGWVEESPETVTQLRAILSANRQIEKERLMPRGNMQPANIIESADATTRIVSRRDHRVI